MATRKNPTPVKKKPRPVNEKNPVLYEIDGIPIRHVNVLTIYIPELRMAKIARVLKGCNLSAAKILSLSSQPCECCKNIPVVVEHRGKYISIPRGLMYIQKTNSGSSIKQKKKKREQNTG